MTAYWPSPEHPGSLQLPAGKSVKLVQVDFIIFNLVRWGKTFTTDERQAAEERQVAALAVQVTARAGARALTLGTAAGGFTLAGRDAMTLAFARLSWRLDLALDR